MHSRRRQTQRSRRCRARHVSPHLFRDARQLELRRLFQEGSDRMGMERATASIQGTKNLCDFSGTISNYETDIFRPIFDEIEKLSGKKYGSTLPKHSGLGSAGVPPVGEGVSPTQTPPPQSPSRRDTATNDRDGRATQSQIDIAFRVV